jgi:hypothetical protein
MPIISCICSTYCFPKSNEKVYMCNYIRLAIITQRNKPGGLDGLRGFGMI